MNWLRKISSRIARPITLRYLSKERAYSYHDITLKILPGVFHPGLFFSTKFLLNYLEHFDLNNKTLLEPGAGSGLISFIAEKKGATVTATDLSERAIEGLRLNRDRLSSKIEIIQSDLFEKIPKQVFDFIVINPPYYPKNVTEEWQLAWNCGEDFEYFRKLFSRLSDYTSANSKVIMVLSEDCDIFTIRNLAKQHKWNLKERNRKCFWWEWNFIYEYFKE